MLLSHRRPKYGTLAAVLFSLATLFSLGCSDGRLKTYPATGKVVFPDGSPVKVGTIECKSQEHGVQATAEIGLDGTFSLTTYKQGDGAVAGSHKCVVVQFVQIDNLANYKPSTIGVVNNKYNSYSTSGLSFRIEPQKNELLIQVDGVHEKSGSSNHGGQPDHLPESSTPEERNRR
ncbi:MAG: hypothetical protein ACOVLE_06540 [Pirellula staleyi]